MSTHLLAPPRAWKRRLLTSACALAALLASAGTASAALQSAVSGIATPQIDVGQHATYSATLTGVNVSHSTPLDVVLVLDESGSISPTDFQREKEFARDVVEGLGARGLFTNGGRIGVVQFDHDARTLIAPSTSQASVLTAINGATQRGGGTCIGCGLRLSTSLLTAIPDRATHNQVAVVLTDGANNQQTGTFQNDINASEAAGIERFAIGVGSYVLSQLQQLASDPDSQHVFTVGQFSELDAIVGSLVEAVDKPGATNIRWEFDVDPGFSVTGVTPTLGSASRTGNHVVWTIPALGAESARLNITALDVAGTCGQRRFMAAGTFSDDEGDAVTTDPGMLEVVGCNEPPSCADASPSVATLWPPNHRWVPVTIEGITDPDGDATTVTITSIRQDEEVDGRGDGSTAPDGRGVGTSTAELRAERSGRGDGRFYHVAFQADDGNGASCTGTVKVVVPKSQSGKPAGDGGPLHDSTTG